MRISGNRGRPDASNTFCRSNAARGIRMSTLSCRFCPHINPAGAKFCSECGSPLHVKPCPKCEAITDASADNCYQCGTPFGAERIPDAAVETAPASAVGPERIESAAAEGHAHVPETMAEHLDVGSGRGGGAGAFKKLDFYRAAAAVVALVAIGAAAYHMYFDATAGRLHGDATIIGEDRRGAVPPAVLPPAPVDDGAAMQAPSARTTALAAPAQPVRAKTKSDAAAIATQRLIDRDMGGFAQQQGSGPRSPPDRDAIATQRLIARDLGKFLPPSSNARAADALPEIN